MKTIDSVPISVLEALLIVLLTWVTDLMVFVYLMVSQNHRRYSCFQKHLKSAGKYSDVSRYVFLHRLELFRTEVLCI